MIDDSSSPLVQYQFGCTSQGTAEVVQSGPLLGTLLRHPKQNDTSKTVASPTTLSSSPSSLSSSSSSSLPLACHLASNSITLKGSSWEYLESVEPVSSLQQASTNATALVLELWMTPEEWTSERTGGPSSSSSSSKTILAIGRSTTHHLHHGNDGDDECTGHHLVVAQRTEEQTQSYLEIRYRDSNAARSCRILVLRQQALTQHTLNHVVVQLQDHGYTQVYIQGQPIIVAAPNTFDATLATWDPHATLQFFASAQGVLGDGDGDGDGDNDNDNNSSNSSSNSNSNAHNNDHEKSPKAVFGGSIYAAAISSQRMTFEQVAQHYEQGLADWSASYTDRDPLKLIATAHHAAVQVPQGAVTPISISVGGTNVSISTLEWSLQVQVTRLPQLGSLWMTSSESTPHHHNGDSVAIEVGQRLPLPDGVHRIQVWYRPDSNDLFTDPRASYSGKDLERPQEGLAFRLVAVWKNETIDGTHDKDEEDTSFLGWSETVEQAIVVLHVNHPSTLLVPAHAREASHQSKQIGGRPRAHLTGVQFHDEADFNIDRVRVDVWTYNGTLTIPESYLSKADFGSCRQNERQALLLPSSSSSSLTWNCHGKGINNRNVTFVAQPNDVSSILSHIEYQGFQWDQPDTIVIRIFDGEGGSCLSWQEHSLSPPHQYNSDIATLPPSERGYPTIHNEECFQIRASVQVPAISLPTPSNKAGSYLRAFFDFDNFGLADVLFWGIFGLVTLTCCVSIRRCIRMWGARGIKIYPDEMDEEIGVVVAPPPP